MSSDFAITARGLSKAYRIAHGGRRATTLGEALSGVLRKPFERVTQEEFWAVKDVDFDIEHGSVVGVIGRNGSGKSTLLKLLSRITQPTRGTATLHGRVGSLLEVGTGFSGELTGGENIFLNGAILGMSQREIQLKFDAIVDFAGVERFLDTPVKRYSSGMYVRLAFAVAAHLNPEILIADEVLAVGDADFQNKCIGKMKEVARDEGRTVLFVSHNMQSIAVLCNRVMVMRAGRVAYFGETEAGIAEHLAAYAPHAEHTPRSEDRPGSGEWRFTRFRSQSGAWDSEKQKTFEFRVERRRATGLPCFLQAHIVNDLGVVVAQCDSRFVEFGLPDSDACTGRFSFTTPWLKPGRYTVDAYVKSTAQNIDTLQDACAFEISPVLPYPTVAADALDGGLVLGQFEWSHDPGID
ncbi:MAG: polysaccharide ABC transporter ATP-binding protein [Armatimonadota bacterium]